VQDRDREHAAAGVDQRHAEQVTQERCAEDQNGPDREVEVLALVARGMSNAEIGQKLYVSPATAKTHVARLLMKLDARDRAQLIILAYETGLVAPQSS
jgi:DNA-binding NarL/FixJ family response regulator